MSQNTPNTNDQNSRTELETIELPTAAVDEFLEVGVPDAREVYDDEGIRSIRFYSDGSIPDAITTDPFEHPQTHHGFDRFIGSDYSWEQFLYDIIEDLLLGVAQEDIDEAIEHYAPETEGTTEYKNRLIEALVVAQYGPPAQVSLDEAHVNEDGPPWVIQETDRCAVLAQYDGLGGSLRAEYDNKVAHAASDILDSASKRLAGPKEVSGVVRNFVVAKPDE